MRDGFREGGVCPSSGWEAVRSLLVDGEVKTAGTSDVSSVLAVLTALIYFFYVVRALVGSYPLTMEGNEKRYCRPIPVLILPDAYAFRCRHFIQLPLSRSHRPHCLLTSCLSGVHSPSAFSDPLYSSYPCTATTLPDHSLPSARSVLDFHNDPLARQQIENAPKHQRDQRAAENDDVVRHGEIRRREIDEERGRVHSLRNALSTTTTTQRRIRQQRPVAPRDGEENGRGKVPAPHRVRGMFGILEERLAEIDREAERALGRDRQHRLERRWSVVSIREEKWRVVDDVGHEIICVHY